LAGVVVATWPKTAALAPGVVAASTTGSGNRVEIPENARRPPVVAPPSTPAPDCTPGENVAGPALSGTDVVALTAAPTGWKSAHCQSGTLSLSATADGQHWKTLDSRRVEANTAGFVGVRHPCLEGAWTYEAKFVSDDSSYKSTHSTAIGCWR